MNAALRGTLVKTGELAAFLCTVHQFSAILNNLAGDFLTDVVSARPSIPLLSTKFDSDHGRVTYITVHRFTNSS